MRAGLVPAILSAIALPIAVAVLVLFLLPAAFIWFVNRQRGRGTR